jgi:hypothetical protein
MACALFETSSRRSASQGHRPLPQSRVAQLRTIRPCPRDTHIRESRRNAESLHATRPGRRHAWATELATCQHKRQPARVDLTASRQALRLTAQSAAVPRRSTSLSVRRPISERQMRRSLSKRARSRSAALAAETIDVRGGSRRHWTPEVTLLDAAAGRVWRCRRRGGKVCAARAAAR